MRVVARRVYLHTSGTNDDTKLGPHLERRYSGTSMVGNDLFHLAVLLVWLFGLLLVLPRAICEVVNKDNGILMPIVGKK